MDELARIERSRQERHLGVRPLPAKEELQALADEHIPQHVMAKRLQVSGKTLTRLFELHGVELVSLRPRAERQEAPPAPPTKSFSEALGMDPQLAPPRTREEVLAAKPAQAPPITREQFPAPPPPQKARPATPVYVLIDKVSSGNDLAGLLYGASQVAAGLGKANARVKLELQEAQQP